MNSLEPFHVFLRKKFLFVNTVKILGRKFYQKEESSMK